MTKIGKDNRSIWLENNTVKIIDQTKLPFDISFEKLNSTSDFYFAIKHMKVRGAPLIGVTAALGLAISVNRNSNIENINKTYNKLLSSRPTAVNLKWALDFLREKLLITKKKDRGILALIMANKIYQDDINSCEKIGNFGYELIKKKFSKKKKE